MLHIFEHPAERLLIGAGRLFGARGKANIQIGKACQEKNCFCVKLVTEGGMSSDKLASIVCINSMKAVFVQLVLIKLLGDLSRDLEFHLP